MSEFIRLVSADAAEGLSIGDGLDAAKDAFMRAKRSQVALVSNLGLTARLHEPGQVNRAKLRGMLRQAREQADRAQAVVAALAESIEAIERVRQPRTQPEETS